MHSDEAYHTGKLTILMSYEYPARNTLVEVNLPSAIVPPYHLERVPLQGCCTLHRDQTL